MGYSVGACTKCGEKAQEKCNMWMYGSPIRYCTRCKQEYLDKRWREIAIDGFDPRSTSPAFYLKCTLAMLAFTAISGGWLYYTMNFRHYYSTLVLSCFIVGCIGSLLCVFMVIRNLTGFEKRSNEKFRKESLQRMQNLEYVKKLQEYGYRIPEEFLHGMVI